jgi:hypothetical protein
MDYEFTISLEGVARGSARDGRCGSADGRLDVSPRDASRMSLTLRLRRRYAANWRRRQDNYAPLARRRRIRP